MQLKLQIVREIEEGIFTITQAQRNYGVQSRKTVVKTAEQRLLELEQENRLLKKQKAALEKELSNSDKKAILFDMMIDLADKEYNIPIRKNSNPK